MPASNAPESSLKKLSLNRSSAAPPLKKEEYIADSWEDEEVSSGDDADRPLSPQQSVNYPTAPPPTPISPSKVFPRENAFVNPFGYTADGPRDAKPDRVAARPEKTDAVARRLIAGALGVRPPKKTEEQRDYEKAVRQKELKRRSDEKAASVRAAQEAERAKQAIWSD